MKFEDVFDSEKGIEIMKASQRMVQGKIFPEVVGLIKFGMAWEINLEEEAVEMKD